MFFPQTHVPGEQGQSDFTDMRELEVMIAGEKFAHLLYHFVLTYSNWESVSICPSESFEALSAGMQTAFWRLGGVPIEHRTDNLSAATHELAESRGRDFTERYRELIDHYGLRASRNFPGNAHENGDVESANGRLKYAIDQRLRLRGSRAFASREAYEGFLDSCVQSRNATRTARIEEERPHLRPLPVRPLPSYRESYATVSRASAVRVCQYEVIQQMRERLPGDHDFELAHVGKIRLTLFSGHMRLRKEHFAVRPRLQTPCQEPPLQGPQLPGAEPPGIAPVHLLPHGFGLQSSILLQQRLDLRPHIGKRIRPRSPRVRRLRFRGGPTGSHVLARRPLAHPGFCRRGHLG